MRLHGTTWEINHTHTHPSGCANIYCTHVLWRNLAPASESLPKDFLGPLGTTTWPRDANCHRRPTTSAPTLGQQGVFARARRRCGRRGRRLLYPGFRIRAINV